MTHDTVTDPYCNRNADEIPSVQKAAVKKGVHPNDIAAEHPTFNAKLHQFACNGCFQRLGLPHPWKAGTPLPGGVSAD